jgi:hypothetical protein
MKILCLDLSNVSVQELPVLDIFDQATKTDIEQTIRDSDAKLTIDVNNVEKFVQVFFSKQGYTVVKTNHAGLWDVQGQPNKKQICKQYSIPETFTEEGCPDFLCLKNTKDWFFIEVKKNSDGYRGSKAEWKKKYGLPVKLVYLIS